MKNDLYNQAPLFRSRLSFLPLLKKWEATALSGETDASKIATGLFESFSQATKLLQPINDYNILHSYKDLVERTAASLFPSTFSKDELNAIAPPFSNNVFYASEAFRNIFMDETGNYLLPFDTQVAANIAEARKALAYKIIFKNFYAIDLAGGDSFICAYPEPSQNIFNYFELTWNWQFVAVSSPIKLPPLPKHFALSCHNVNDLSLFPGLTKLLPLEQFIFDGLMLLSVKNVTERETAKQVRDILQQDDALEDPQKISFLKNQLGYLLQQKIDVGLTSFHKDYINNENIPQSPSIILKYIKSPQEWKLITGFLLNKFQDYSYYHIPANEAIDDNPFAMIFKNSKWQSAVYAALLHNGEIIGCLEIYLSETVENLHPTIVKLRTVIPYLELALHQKENDFQLRINRVVKDHFTAVQPAVEWKFNQIATHFLLQMLHTQTPKMGVVLFDNVFPLYAAFDIKNSSAERNKAVQKDLLLQLQWVKKLFQQAKHHCYFPILEEIESKVDEYIQKISSFLLSTDEQVVYNLLKMEAAELLYNLMEMTPALKDDISMYFQALEKPANIINQHQKKFDESVMAINHYLSGFLDREQLDAQKNYPHYFDRFATDGVDFNMYIGQSIAPEKKFNLLYLKNLRLWQLKILAMAARHLIHTQHELALPLETTQLILVYNQPISIKFRTAERKFDVDGTYNARYEVVKKRIDKAYIKNSNDRLTKPGTIAIIYFSEEDAQEYCGYIDFLKKENLLEGDIEKLELEELQGVNGLKALRINIKLHDQKNEQKKNKEIKSKPET